MVPFFIWLKMLDRASCNEKSRPDTYGVACSDVCHICWSLLGPFLMGVLNHVPRVHHATGGMCADNRAGLAVGRLAVKNRGGDRMERNHLLWGVGGVLPIMEGVGSGKRVESQMRTEERWREKTQTREKDQRWKQTYWVFKERGWKALIYAIYGLFLNLFLIQRKIIVSRRRVQIKCGRHKETYFVVLDDYLSPSVNTTDYVFLFSFHILRRLKSSKLILSLC